MSNIKNIFNLSKYTKWYLILIENAKTRTIKIDGEWHHVIPKSLGGTELVKLTYREHFIAHLLLRKMMIELIHKQKMEFAFFIMCNGFNHSSKYTNSRWFEVARKQSSIIKSLNQKNKPKSKTHCNNMSLGQQKSYKNGTAYLVKINTNPRTSKHCINISKSKQGKAAAWLSKDNASEICNKISIAKKGKTFTTEHCLHLSLSHIGQTAWNKGQQMTEQQKTKLKKPKSDAHKLAMKKPKSRICCRFCKREMGTGPFKVFHTNCF